MIIAAVLLLALTVLAMLVGRAIDRAVGDDARRNLVALVAELADDRAIADNLDL